MLRKKRKSFNLEKVFSSLLILCIIVGLMPASRYTASANGTITAELPANFVELGGTAKILVKDSNGTAVTDAAFQSQDTNVASVDSNGIVTGIALGKTTVTVTSQGVSATVEVSVVGENLLTRQGVKNGAFEGGIYNVSETPSTTSQQYFWYNNFGTTGNYSYQQHELLSNHATYVNSSTNVLKYTFGENTQGASYRSVRLQTFNATGLYAGTQGNQNGTIPVDTNKLYEYTGWLKAVNTTALATDIMGELFYYNGSAYINNAYKNIKPWLGKSGNQDWTYFSVNSTPLNTWNPSYTVGADVRINTIMAGKQGDILVADLSFHEVKYDRLDFTATIPDNLGVNTVINTAVKHYSNTGKEILNVTSETGTVVPISVTYASSNPSVATVSEAGVITTAGLGNAEITATSTLGGVTRTGTIIISVRKDLFYNYWKLSLRSATGNSADGNTATSLSTVTSFNMTTEGAEGEIYPRSLYPNTTVTTDPWHYAGIGGGATSFSFTDYAYGLMLDKNTGAWGRLNVRVPADGIYRAANINGHWSNGAIVRIYLAPDSAENPMAPEYSLGMLDTYQSTAEWKKEDNLGSRMLEAGDYYLTYEILGKNSANMGNARYAVGEFKLYPVNTYPTMEVTAEPLPVIKAGQSVETGLSSAMSDGSAQDLYAATITATPRDSNIANAIIVTSANKQKRSIQVTGVNVGSTIFDISITLDGQIVDMFELPVTVGLGTFTSAMLSVSDAPSGRIANKTNHILKLKLLDEYGNQLPDETASVTYRVASSSVVTVTTDGVIKAHSNGTTTVNVTVVMDGITVNTNLSINVCESGENFLADKNGDFESEITDANWDWTCGYSAPESTDDIAQWTVVDTQERDGNVNNKALAIVLNPNVAPQTFNEVTLKANQNGRVQLQPGRLYELSAWIKTDNLTAPDGTLFDFYVDLYDYSNAFNAQNQFPVQMYRNLNYKYDSGYPNSYSNWKKITLPIAAPTNYEGELWVTPRIVFQHPNYSTITQTGYGGKLWIDNIELREVGFDRIEATRTGSSAAYGDVSTITLTPYSTTNNFISILQDQIPNLTATVSSDSDIISTSAATTANYTGAISQVTSMAKVPSIAATVKGKNGDTTVDCSVTIGSGKHSTAVSYTLSNLVDMFGIVTVTAGTQVMKPDTPGTQLSETGTTYSGTPLDLSGAQITYSSSDTAVATVNSTGYVSSVGAGSTLITATVTLNGITRTGQIYISVNSGKTASSYYTESKISAARTNIQSYTWASSIKDTAVAAADPYVGKEDILWNMVTTQGLPRGITVGFLNDPDAYTCRYCKADLRAYAGYYPWLSDPMLDPWKIKCPVCKRKFPSNDFENFYKSGINEHGNFQYEQALINGQEYLKNELYPEMGEGWGVDDGYGYQPGRTYDNGVTESHTYIAYYNHWGLWHSSGSNPGVIITALDSLRDAYLYTGDNEYGRTGAILIDRIADVYPDFDLLPYNQFYNSHGMTYEGKTIGRIWECVNAKSFAYAYDAFYPEMNDQYVVNFLKDKASQFGMDNTKDTPVKIRQNCEDGILRSIFEGCKTAQIYGNFGMHQSTLSLAAVVLDSMPESKEWIDWVFKPGAKTGSSVVTGGNVLPQLVNIVNRDGHGNESAPGYNNIWLGSTLLIADILADYEGYPTANLYLNPKFKKMFTAFFPLTLVRRATAQIGDSGNTASTGFEFNNSDMIKGFQYYGDSKIAKMIYFLNGNKTAGIHSNIFTSNPEAIASDIQNIINTQGTYNFDKSEQIPAYGFSIVRGGTYVNASTDTQRDFWMYYGGGTVHKHPDALNLGIHAYGLDMAPDLGYPETAGPEPNRAQWINNTISHNTVVVDEAKQTSLTTNGTPMHFDDAGKVKVMDADDAKVYSSTDIYRRTVVMVEASDDVAYGVDFFRIRGGNDHMYSFHSQSNTISETQGINLVEQTTGTYAGPDVPWGANDNYLNGYSWLDGVRKDSSPGTGNFTLDFKVTDFRKVLPSGRDAGLHLRMTMLNNFNLSEVSICKGTPPRISANNMFPELDYVLARHTGVNLDTLFTTIFEPYDTTRYISSLESVPTAIVSGTEGSTDIVKAIKVTFASDGRVDYIVYATNETVEYRIDDLFNFKGFLGVCTRTNGVTTYTYVNDGTLIDNLTATNAAVTGTVTDFTQTLSSTNTITVTKNFAVDPATLAGKFIYITNDGTENAVYEIISAENSGDNLVLNIGDATPTRGFLDSDNINGGYTYNIAAGQSYRIPLSKENN